MRVVIDRFEGEIAVLGMGEKTLRVPRDLFPGAHEGDAAEISVLCKAIRNSEETPHELFDHLRKKRKASK